MIAITTSNSINVNARIRRDVVFSSGFGNEHIVQIKDATGCCDEESKACPDAGSSAREEITRYFPSHIHARAMRNRCGKLLHLPHFEESVQLAYARGMAHLAERFGLDLPDAFARDAELLAHLFERAGIAVTQAETQGEDHLLALTQAAEHVGEFVFQQAEARDLGRIFT